MSDLVPVPRWQRDRTACVGAFARYMLPRWPRLRLELDYEPGIDRADCSRTMALLRLRTGEILNITAVIPWPGPDPRGPEHETRPMVWGGRGGRQLVRSSEREPMRLQTLVFARDVERPSVLDRHAQIAAIRAARELDRGFAVTTNNYAPIGGVQEPELFGDRKQLPPPTCAVAGCEEACELAYCDWHLREAHQRWPSIRSVPA